jgi:hypothetical protein
MAAGGSRERVVTMIKRPPFDFETPKELNVMLNNYVDVLERKKQGNRSDVALGHISHRDITGRA